MKIDLSAANACCTKCKRAVPLARHHTGCEAMWLRHFKAKRRTKRYQEFEARYNRFEEQDIVRLCHKCHQTIHNLYFVAIGHFARASGEQFEDWSWADAEQLMAYLRNLCMKWLEFTNRIQ